MRAKIKETPVLSPSLTRCDAVYRLCNARGSLAYLSSNADGSLAYLNTNILSAITQKHVDAVITSNRLASAP